MAYIICIQLRGLEGLVLCRYETEEDPEVCASMERIANGFLAEMEAS